MRLLIFILLLNFITIIKSNDDKKYKSMNKLQLYELKMLTDKKYEMKLYVDGLDYVYRHIIENVQKGNYHVIIVDCNEDQFIEVKQKIYIKIQDLFYQSKFEILKKDNCNEYNFYA
jgi:hypothetical protein